MKSLRLSATVNRRRFRSRPNRRPSEQQFCCFFSSSLFLVQRFVPRAKAHWSERRDVRRIPDFGCSTESVPLFCASLWSRRSCFPSTVNEEFNGSVGGHVRFIDAVVSWNTLKLYSLQTRVCRRSLFRGALMASAAVWVSVIPSARVVVFTTVMSEVYGSRLICVH